MEGCDALIRLVPRLGHFLTHPALPRRYAACPQPAEPRRSCCTTASTGSYDAPSKLACCAPWKGTHVAPTAPLDGLPSLLLVLYATRLIGLLLRASTSTAQSVTISFTNACASGEHKEANSLRLSSSRVRTPEHGSDVAYPSAPILVCAFSEHRRSNSPCRFFSRVPPSGSTEALCVSARFLLAPQEPRDRNPYSQGVTGFGETLALRLSRSTDRSIWAHPIPAKDVPPRFSVNSIVRCPDPEVVHCA